MKVSFTLTNNNFEKHFYFEIFYKELNYGFWFLEYIDYTYQKLFKNKENIEIYPFNSNQLFNKFNTKYFK